MDWIFYGCFGYMIILMLGSFSEEYSPRSPIFYIIYGAMILILSLFIQIGVIFLQSFGDKFKQAAHPINQDYILFAIFIVGLVTFINGIWQKRIKESHQRKYLH